MIGEAAGPAVAQGERLDASGRGHGSLPALATTRSARQRREVAVVALLALVAVALRIWQIDRESLWLDEAGRVAIASLPFGQIAHGVAVVELSPPLYHYVLAAWTRLAGDGDAAVRLLSALLAVPAVALGWSLGRAAAGPRVGFAVAAFVATSPFAVHYGQEAGMYALLLPLALGTIRAAVGVLSPLSGVPDERKNVILSEAEDPSFPGSDFSASGLRMTPSAYPVSDSSASGLGMTGSARRARSGWLAAYVLLGALSVYTHYYAGFLLLTVAVVAVVHSLARWTPHGVVIWVAAHLVIALAFVPWLPALVSQAGLAASVEDWRGVAPADALLGWSAALFADGATGWASPLAVVVAMLGSLLGAWRLRRTGPVLWLLVGLVVVPLVLATLASGFFHSFRERGFIAVAGAPWVLVASAVLVPDPETSRSVRPLHALRPAVGKALRPAIAAAVVVLTLLGLGFHYGEQKEDWRGAAAVVAASAGPQDPIFFVHYAAEVPFDRYFSETTPRIGLPESFDWVEGYHARYLVRSDDVARRVPPALADAQQAWAVLSHDGGRGSEYLVAALDRWGTRVSDRRLVGVRVLEFQRRG